MEFIKNICKGAVIGISNVIPGVSGGTMAVVMGIYDKLIHCITHLFSQFKKNFFFLLPIIIGAALAIIGGSFGLEFLFQQYPMPTNLFFIGLILGGLPAMTRKVKGKKVNIGHILAFAVFFILVVMMAVMGEKEGADANIKFDLTNVIKLFGVGVLSSATMVIPGVSGAMMLLLIGYYHPILETINDFMRALSARDIDGLIHGFSILFPFGIGVIIGIFVIAKIIEFIFKKFPQYAYWAIIGLILASPVAIIFMNLSSFAFNPLLIVISLVTFIIGFFVAMKLGE